MKNKTNLFIADDICMMYLFLNGWYIFIMIIFANGLSI